jgi:hypothetical protein
MSYKPNLAKTKKAKHETTLALLHYLVTLPRQATTMPPHL